MATRAWSAYATHWPVLLRPAPACDPPFDEERPPDWCDPDVVQPLLELPGIPGVESRAPRWPGESRPAGSGPAPAGASPATTAAAVRFANTCLEILNGYRPVTGFRALSTPLAAATVLEAMTEAVRRLRTAARSRGGMVKLRAMRTCEPRPGIAELAMVVATGGRTGPAAGPPARRPPPGRAWGLAFRLEQQHGRWQCTAARML